MPPDKALPGSPEVPRRVPPGGTRLRAYTKLVNHVLAALAALFEFVTGEPAPKLKDVLRNGG